MYACLGRLHSYSSIEQHGIKSLSSHQLLSSDWLSSASSHCHNVACLALFYHYFHANCSSDLANCMPPLLPLPRCTRLASSSHPYSVHLSNARVNQYPQFFIPFSGKLWTSLPASVFPSAYDLNSFTREVSRYLSLSFGYWFETFPGTSTSVGFFVIFLLPYAASLLHKKEKK